MLLLEEPCQISTPPPDDKIDSTGKGKKKGVGKGKKKKTAGEGHGMQQHPDNWVSLPPPPSTSYRI